MDRRIFLDTVAFLAAVQTPELFRVKCKIRDIVQIFDLPGNKPVKAVGIVIPVADARQVVRHIALLLLFFLLF